VTTTTVKPGVDALRMRQLMGHFPTGVAVVTVEHRGIRHGMTVNSLTSVSLEPALVLVCLASETRTARAVRARGEFVINLLGDGQDELARCFSRPGVDDRYAGLPTRTNDAGLPELPALAHLRCAVREVHPGGDHEIFIADVRDADLSERAPLVFHRGQFHSLADDGRDAGWYW
jgi:flavin reductase (DIM6/NTAB) family NADH-FMN oxidoreductase RutF